MRTWWCGGYSLEINLKITERFEAEGIGFAFPTSTTYLAQDDRRPLHIRVSGDDIPDDISVGEPQGDAGKRRP